MNKMNKKIFLSVVCILLAGSALGFSGIKLTRGGYESPEYKSKKHPSGFEIRNYSAMTVVSTKKEKSKKTFSKFMWPFKIYTVWDLKGQVLNRNRYFRRDSVNLF